MDNLCVCACVCVFLYIGRAPLYQLLDFMTVINTVITFYHLVHDTPIYNMSVLTSQQVVGCTCTRSQPNILYPRVGIQRLLPPPRVGTVMIVSRQDL